MAIAPMFRSPSRSILDFAEERAREAASIGDVITNLAKPLVQQTEPTPQPLGTFTGPALQPTLAQETVTPEFMDRLFTQESGYNPNAVSPKGAVGTGQVLPSTAMDPGYGVPTIFDLADEQGVDYGARTREEAKRLLFNDDLNRQFSTLYADAMASQFGGDPALTAAAYNAGPGAVSAYGGVPPYAETQNYVRALTGGGGDTRMGGGAGADTLGGFNVEDILASLYPQENESDARAQRRRDILAGVSQVFGALDVGAAPDVSNIRAAQEERRRQATLDMRERERARAAASLVYSQTGDAGMAGAIATGAISYGDVVSERERKRVEAEADRQRVLAEQQAGRLAGIVETAWPDLGLPDAMKTQVLESIAAGDDPNTVFTLQEQARVAEAARKAEEDKAEAAATRAAAVEAFSTSQNPVEQAAGRYLALDPNLTLDDALARAQELLKTETQEGYTLSPGQTRFGPNNQVVASVPAAAGADQTYQFQAEIAQRMQALGEDEATATRAVLDKPENQGFAIQLDANGRLVSATMGGTAAPAGAVGGTLGATAPGTATVMTPNGLQNVPVPGAIAPEAAAVDLAAQKQALDEAIAAAPNNLARSQLELQKLTLEISDMAERQDIDARTREATLAGLQADVAKKEAEVAALERDQAAQGSAEYENAMRQYGVMEEAAKTVLDDVFSTWATGTAGGLAQTIGGPLNIPTMRSTMLAKAKQLGSQAMLKALVEAKAAGVTMTPVSNLDVSALGASESALLEPENLQANEIANAVVMQYNYTKDQLFGPKDLTRLDQYGNEYTVGANTLGVSEDTFARHWAQIPPEVAEAWRTGDLPLFPTDDPAYAEAANVLNAMTTNWELYQGDLDRTEVGAPEEPVAPVDTADLPPPPPNVSEEEWPEVWQYMSEEARAAYIAQTEGAK